MSSLFEPVAGGPSLPTDYIPRPVEHFSPERIFLSRGSVSTPQRRRFVERICGVYPDALVVECLDTPHNKIDLGEPRPLERHRQGKKTLVFGELKQAVRYSSEEGNTCPNYWHFSPYGFCPYGCTYCYLAGTPGTWFSPTVKIFVNLPEMLAEIGRGADRIGRPTAYYVGKLQDGLALDPLTAYSTVLVPFFASHRFARQIVLTKSADAGNLLGLNHGGNTILSWSVNPPQIASRLEQDVPSIAQRLEAMRQCAAAGYPVRAVMMPIVPVDGWAEIYSAFLEQMLRTVRLERLTIGGICSYRTARSLMEAKLGRQNEISSRFAAGKAASDGRIRYDTQIRAMMYRHMIDVARKLQPDLEPALCLEEPALWQSVGADLKPGRCNCVL